MVEGKSIGLRGSKAIADTVLRTIDDAMDIIEETTLEDDHLDYDLVGSWFFMKLAKNGLERWLKDA